MTHWYELNKMTSDHRILELTKYSTTIHHIWKVTRMEDQWMGASATAIKLFKYPYLLFEEQGWVLGLLHFAELVRASRAYVYLDGSFAQQHGRLL